MATFAARITDLEIWAEFGAHPDGQHVDIANSEGDVIPRRLVDDAAEVVAMHNAAIERIRESVDNFIPERFWVPVGDRLPAAGEVEGQSVTVLLSTKSTGIVTGHVHLREPWMNDRDAEGLPAWVANYPVGWMSAGGDVTHWMPIPEAPK